MSIFEVELGTLKAERQLDPLLTDHDKEIARLARILHEHRGGDLSIVDCVGIVFDTISNYEPPVSWREIEPGPDLQNIGFKWMEISAQIGSTPFKYRTSYRENESASTLVTMKRYLGARVGKAVYEWMEGNSK